jgi:hypothetical protein
LARLIVLIPHLFRFADTIIFRKDYSPPSSPPSRPFNRRLGHPGRDVLMQLSRSSGLPCTRAPDEHLCHACQLGRHIRLPFHNSTSHVARIFDLVHCDLWTSPVIIISGYKYYLVVVDDFSHYLWTFPLRAKSDTFPMLLHFFSWVST